MNPSNVLYQRCPLNFVSLYQILLLLYRNSILIKSNIDYKIFKNPLKLYEIVSYTLKRNIKTDQRISNIKFLTLVSSMSLKQLSIV